MTTNGPIYRMVEERIVNLYGLDAQAEGNTDYISRCQELESLLPHIEEIEPVWIPVEERLPSIAGIYNTVNQGIVGSMFYSDNGYGWMDGIIEYYPTHWQPLPQPPTK